jgi:hypothetical protein
MANILKKINKFFNQHADMKICMMGPRGVGKTTILTSIFYDTDKYFAPTKLKFIPEQETLVLLSERLNALSDIFDRRTSITEKPVAGISASYEENSFGFTLGLKGKPACVSLTIKDFPGEWVEPQNINHGKITQFIKESQVLLSAIDTVHLMEETG